MQSRGVMRQLIHRFKYGGETWLAELLGEILRQGLRDARLIGKFFDAVVPVPLHPLRRREREFNQAEVVTSSSESATLSLRRTSIVGVA